MTKKVLIATFSRTGHTQRLADQLAYRISGTDQYQIKVAPDTYSSDMYETADIAKQEIATGDFPALTEKLSDYHQYDLILIGSPVWSGMPAAPIYSFLKSISDFKGVVATFYTDAGMPGDYEQVFKKWAGSLKILPAHRETNDLMAWIRDTLQI